MEQLKLKGIKLVFENVTVSDELQVNQSDTTDVEYLNIESICSNINFNHGYAYQYQDCSRLDLILNPSCNKKWHEFNADTLEPDSDTILFERIQHNDIVSIELIFLNQPGIELYVPWNDENEYVNSYQSNMIDKDGKLHINISKNFEGFKENYN